jgi:hypothetical protein
MKRVANKKKTVFKDYNELENARLILSYGPEVYEYSRQIEDSLLKSNSENGLLNILANHDIGPKIRTKLVDWLLEVFYAYKCDENTIYLTLTLMDGFIFKTKQLNNSDLHLLGITCLYISSKFEDLYPLDLSTVKGRIAHNKFSEKEIKDKEKQILHLLDFKLVHATMLEFIKNFIYDFTFNNKSVISKINTNNETSILENTAIYISKILLHSHDFSHYKNSLKAICCIICAFDLVRTNVKNFNKDMEVFTNEWIKFLVEQSRYEPEQIMELYEKIKKYYSEFDDIPNIQHNLKKNSSLPF